MALVDNTTTQLGFHRNTTTDLRSNVVLANSVLSGPMRTVRVYRDSVNTPGFKSGKVKILPYNPFYYFKSDYSGLSGFLSDTNPGVSETIHVGNALHYYAASPDTTPASLSESERAAVDTQAVLKLRLKVKDQKINLAQAYAERKMTADLVSETAVKLAKSFSALKRGDFSSAASALGLHAGSRAVRTYKRKFERSQSKATASGWLQLQYGWGPLLNDVYGLAEFLAQKIAREVHNKASSSATRSAEVQTQQYRRGSINNYDGLETKVSKTDYTVKYSVRFATSNEAPRTLNQLGISNPALLAWELLPYSFVVDWFIPIGNYLSSLDATLGLTFLDGSRTTFERTHVHGTRVGQTVYNVTNLSESYDMVRCVRTRLTSWPSASFPGFKNPLSLTHAANAIALLTSTFMKK